MDMLMCTYTYKYTTYMWIFMAFFHSSKNLYLLNVTILKEWKLVFIEDQMWGKKMDTKRTHRFWASVKSLLCMCLT